MAKTAGGALESKIREYALTFPGAVEEFPWGHSAMKVKGKAFLFMGTDEKGVFSISVKLPHSRDMALDLPFAEPTGYGLGKSGWVTATIKGKEAPLDLIRAWIRESYTAIAPKKLLKELEDSATPREKSARGGAKAKNPAPSRGKRSGSPRKAG